MADSFGEYPFQVELSPASMFTRKLQLILYRLFSGPRPHLLSEAIQTRFESERYADKVHRSVISTEERNIRTVFTAYGLASLYMIILIPTYFGAALGAQLKKDFAGNAAFDYFVTAALTLGAPVGIYFVIAAFRIFLYFREKFKFQKALLAVLPEAQQTIWRRLNLLKLRMFYYSSLIVPFFCILYAAVLMVVLLVAVSSW